MNLKITSISWLWNSPAATEFCTFSKQRPNLAKVTQASLWPVWSWQRQDNACSNCSILCSQNRDRDDDPGGYLSLTSTFPGRWKCPHVTHESTRTTRETLKVSLYQRTRDQWRSRASFFSCNTWALTVPTHRAGFCLYPAQRVRRIERFSQICTQRTSERVIFSSRAVPSSRSLQSTKNKEK